MKAREPFLTREQFTAWTTFGPEWKAFKQAWLGRGLLWPPAGSYEDDADATTQRHMLWQVLDARPNDLVRWTREARGRTAHAVIAYIVGRFHEIRDAEIEQ